MFIQQRSQCCRNVISSQIDLQVQCNPINTLIDFYVEFNKINILEVYRGQRSKNNQQTIKKKNRDLIK